MVGHIGWPMVGPELADRPSTSIEDQSDCGRGMNYVIIIFELTIAKYLFHIIYKERRINNSESGFL